MANNYFYNPNTDKLHIYGLCHFSKALPVNIVWFDDENDALRYDGRAVSMCKLCQAKREKER